MYVKIWKPHYCKALRIVERLLKSVIFSIKHSNTLCSRCNEYAITMANADNGWISLDICRLIVNTSLRKSPFLHIRTTCRLPNITLLIKMPRLNFM